MSDNEHIGLSLEEVRPQEAHRRLKLLGKLVEQPYAYEAFRKRSLATLIPMPLLKAWHDAYTEYGIDGLLPDWNALPSTSYLLIRERYMLLRPLADQEIITKEDIRTLAEKLGWLELRTRQWLLRYRLGGLWGLSPTSHERKRQEKPARMIDSITEKDLYAVERRVVRLGWLLAKIHISNKDVEQRAQEAGCSPRTLWNDLRRYRTYGSAGLAREERSDKGGRHGDQWYTDIIVALRLTKKDATINWIYDEVCKRSRQHGRPEPSLWKVRQVCSALNDGIKAIADGRERRFRNSSRFAGVLDFEGVVYEVDHTLIDTFVKDLRSPKYRSEEGLVRPWMTSVIEASSRLFVAAVFSYDRPNRFTVAEALRQAFITSNEHPYGGIPHEVRIDKGRDLISQYVRIICHDLGIYLNITHIPEHKPHVERFFGTLNTKLWANQDGYTHSNVKERNETAEEKVPHTIASLEKAFWEYINDIYHKEVHSSLGMTPIAKWEEACFTTGADPEILNTLLMEPVPRKVSKGRISLDDRTYIHPELADYIGSTVYVRRPTHYTTSDWVEVYKNGKWICRAVAITSDL